MLGPITTTCCMLGALLQAAQETPTIRAGAGQSAGLIQALAAYPGQTGAQNTQAGTAAGYLQALTALQPTQDPNNPQLQSLAWSLTRANDDGLGLTLDGLDPALRKQLNVAEGQGLVVSAITPGGPAERAGLLASDILLTLNDQPLAESDDLAKRLKEAGEKAVPLALLRGGKPLSISVRPRYRVTFGPAEPEKPQFYIGVRTTPVDGLMRSHLQLPEGQGLVVSSVVEEGPARKSGLLEGDVVLEVSGTPLTDTEGLGKAVRESEGKPLSLKLVRGGQPTTLNVTPAPRPEADAVVEAQPAWIYQAYPNRALVNYLYPVNPQDNTLLWRPEGQATAAFLGQRLQAGNPDQVEALRKEVETLRKQIDELKQALEKK